MTVNFESLTVVIMNIDLFCNVITCNLVNIYHGITPQERVSKSGNVERKIKVT
jgi:hypothetical protein